MTPLPRAQGRRQGGRRPRCSPSPASGALCPAWGFVLLHLTHVLFLPWLEIVHQAFCEVAVKHFNDFFNLHQMVQVSAWGRHSLLPTLGPAGGLGEGWLGTSAPRVARRTGTR